MINCAAQVAYDDICDQKVLELKKAIKLTKDASVQQINYKFVELQSLTWKEYTESAFSSNEGV